MNFCREFFPMVSEEEGFDDWGFVFEISWVIFCFRLWPELLLLNACSNSATFSIFVWEYTTTESEIFLSTNCGISI